MPEIHVTTEMCAAGVRVYLDLEAKYGRVPAWGIVEIYRAMRAAEPPLCRGEPVEILCGTTSQIEAAVARFARRIEDMADEPAFESLRRLRKHDWAREFPPSRGGDCGSMRRR